MIGRNNLAGTAGYNARREHLLGKQVEKHDERLG